MRPQPSLRHAFPFQTLGALPIWRSAGNLAIAIPQATLMATRAGAPSSHETRR